MQNELLDRCKSHIEAHLEWGPSSAWTTQDFEELSFQIQEKTSQVISATTLKRIWGRVAYDSSPSRHSLDTLAAFLGHDNWRRFTQSVTADSSSNDSVTQPAAAVTVKPRRAVSLVAVSMLLLGGAIVLWLGGKSLPQPSEPDGVADNIRFISRPLASDLPNTVIFEYDVRNVPADSFFIQQSWDSRRRTRISSDNNVLASTYFYPGFYNAKLIANDEVIQELPVHVKTDDWAALLVEYPEPIYLPEESLLQNGTLTVSNAWLDEAGYSLDSEDYRLGYYYVQDFGPLHTDNFKMEAVIRHIKPAVQRPCRGAQFMIRAENGMINFPLDVAGCAGVMHVMAGEVHHDGEKYDLSALGADYSSWQQISLDVKDKKIRFQVGTNAPYTLEFTDDMGKLVGLWFHFAGQGMIDEVTLSDGQDRIIYKESF